MLYTVIDFYDIFYNDTIINKAYPRSTNPYSYIRSGYYIDGAALFGGQNNVNFNIHYPSDISIDMLDITNK